jgi:hypothetical protein
MALERETETRARAYLRHGRDMKTQYKGKRPKVTKTMFTPSEVEREFGLAIERVYRRYGTDISAFARDVQRDIQKMQEARELEVQT